MPGLKNECIDFISRNIFDFSAGRKSEELTKEAFTSMDLYLDANMTMIRRLDAVHYAEYQKAFWDIYKHLEKRPEPFQANKEQWK